MNPTIEIYLGKNSQTFGPYTVEQFESIQASPDYSTYTFIWDGRDSNADWKPIEKAPAPPALARKQSPGTPPPDEKVHQLPARPMLRGYDVPGLEALCHDTRHVISGRLTQVTDAGCELVCPQSSVAPAFGSQSNVVLNLLEPKSGRSMNVTARLCGVRRQDGCWSLKVLWKSCPELVVQLLEKSI